MAVCSLVFVLLATSGVFSQRIVGGPRGYGDRSGSFGSPDGNFIVSGANPGDFEDGAFSNINSVDFSFSDRNGDFGNQFDTTSNPGVQGGFNVLSGQFAPAPGTGNSIEGNFGGSISVSGQTFQNQLDGDFFVPASNNFGQFGTGSVAGQFSQPLIDRAGSNSFSQFVPSNQFVTSVNGFQTAPRPGSGQFAGFDGGVGAPIAISRGTVTRVIPGNVAQTAGQFFGNGIVTPRQILVPNAQFGSQQTLTTLVPVVQTLAGGIPNTVTRQNLSPVTRVVAGSTITSVVQQSVTPTVTQTLTLDRFVTLTDVAFQSVQVTITSLLVHTIAGRTTEVVTTPVNDRVALQTNIVTSPSILTITQIQTDFTLLTAVSVDHVTITHHSYVVRQSTFTTTATQAVTLTRTLVRTIVHTDRVSVTKLHTITDTVLVSAAPKPSYY